MAQFSNSSLIFGSNQVLTLDDSTPSVSMVGITNVKVTDPNAFVVENAGGTDLAVFDTTNMSVDVTGKVTITETFTTESSNILMDISLTQSNSTGNLNTAFRTIYNLNDPNATGYAQISTFQFGDVTHSGSSGYSWSNNTKIEGKGTIAVMETVSSKVTFATLIGYNTTVTTAIGMKMWLDFNADHANNTLTLTNGYDAFQSTSRHIKGKLSTTSWLVGFRAKDITVGGGSGTNTFTNVMGVNVEWDLSLGATNLTATNLAGIVLGDAGAQGSGGIGTITSVYGALIRNQTLTASNHYGVYIEEFTSGQEIMLAGAGEIFFRDTAIHVGSLADGHLDLTADVSVDINANLDISTKNIITDTTTGTQIATGATQKLGFFGVTPVVQPSHIVDADGTLADITSKFNTLLAQIASLGLQASA
jgi:hypothetical protein